MKIRCWRELTCFVSWEPTIASVERGEVDVRAAGGKGITELGCNLCSSGMETTASFSDLLSKDKRKLLLLSLILLLRIVTRSPMSPASETLSHSASSLSVWWLMWLDMLNERLLMEEPPLLILSIWTLTQPQHSFHHLKTKTNKIPGWLMHLPPMLTLYMCGTKYMTGF